jgi:mannose-1-phosphate guanylyltransferase
MYSAFVLAAGLGTRLRPLTEHRPKPLVPVCGVPLLAYSLALCARHGLRDVVVNAHWLAGQIEAWAGEREGVNVSVSTELPEVLGTGGGLRKVADQLASPFVVLNGDVLHDVDLTALLAAVPAGGAAMALRRDPEHAPRYGIVAQDSEGRIVELTTVASAEPRGPVDRTTHFTGIHAMTREALERVPGTGFACVVRTSYRGLVPERQVGAVRYDGVWLDAGDPLAYLDANLQVLTGGARPALDPFPRAAYARTADGRVVGDPAILRGATVKGACWVGPGAKIGQWVELKDSIVGAGSVVPDGMKLDQTVVWDGITEPRFEEYALRRAIVHPGGVLAT